MAYGVMTLTLKGADLLAAATTADKLIIAGCDATTTFIDKSDAINVENRPANPFSTTTEAYLEKSTDNHVFVRVFFVAGQSTGGNAKSLYVYGHKESDPTNDYVLGVLSSQEPFHLPEEGDISNTYSALLDIIYAPAEGAVTTATTSVFATYGEFADLRDRVVTTHKRDLPTTGDDQVIYGEKTFMDSIHSNVFTPDSWIYQDDHNSNRFCIQTNISESSTTLLSTVGFNSKMLKNDTYTSLVLVEEQIFKDPFVAKKVGTLKLEAKDEDSSKSATVELSTYYDNNNLISSVDIGSYDVSVEATNKCLLVSDDIRLASSGSVSDPFNNYPYAYISVDRANLSKTHQISFRIVESSQLNYYILFEESDSVTHKASLYTYYDNIDLGKSNKKWDNVYANKYYGDVYGKVYGNIYNATTIESKSSETVSIVGDNGILLFSANSGSSVGIYFDKETNINYFAFYPVDTIHLGTPTYKWESVNAKKFVGDMDGNATGLSYYSGGTFTQLLRVGANDTIVPPTGRGSTITIGSSGLRLKEVLSDKFTGDLYGDVHGKIPNTFTYDSTNNKYTVDIGTILWLGIDSLSGSLSGTGLGGMYLPGSQFTTTNDISLYITCFDWDGSGTDAKLDCAGGATPSYGVADLASGQTFRLLCAARPGNSGKSMCALAMRVS